MGRFKRAAVTAAVALLALASASAVFVGVAPKASAGTWYDWGWWQSSTGGVHMSLQDTCPDFGETSPGKLSCRVIHLDEHLWASNTVVTDAGIYRLPEWVWPEVISHGAYGSAYWEVVLDLWSPYRIGTHDPFDRVQWRVPDGPTGAGCNFGVICGAATNAVVWRQANGDLYNAGNDIHHRGYSHTENSVIIQQPRGTVFTMSILV